MENGKKIIDAEIVTEKNPTTEIAPVTRTVSDCKGQEITVYGENGEVLSTSFDRIDFDNPQSILQYGADVTAMVSQILSDASKLYEEGKVIKIDQAMLDKLVTFEESLDESEKEKAKEEKKPAFVKVLEGIIKKLNPKAEEEEKEKTTYTGRLEAYLENVRLVEEAVESQKIRQINDITTRKDTLDTIKPLLQLLDEMVKVARIDEGVFDQEVKLLQGVVNPDIDTELERRRKTQIAGLAKNRLDRLTSNLISLKQTAQLYEDQQFAAMSLVDEQDAFLTHTSKILESQGGLMIQNRILSDDIAGMANVTLATNQAVAANADRMLENAQAVVELRLNGGMTLETLQHVNKVLVEGKAVYEKGDKLMQEKLAKGKAEHEKLLANLQDFADTSASYLANNSLIGEVLENASKGSRPSASVKKIGTYPTGKGKRK